MVMKCVVLLHSCGQVCLEDHTFHCDFNYIRIGAEKGR